MKHTGALRVAILGTHPVQYHAPLWRRLAARTDLTVRVFYGSDLSVRGYRDEGFGVQVRWDVPLLMGYEYVFLSRDPALQRVDFWRPNATGLRGQLAYFRPDVVLLTAYNSRFWIGGLLAARGLSVPVVMRHEASDEAVSRSALKGYVRDQALRVFYSKIARFAAIGTNARNHLLRLGIPPERIGSSPYCVDSEQIEKQVMEWLPRRAELRTALDIGPEDIALIFSGKLIQKKQPLLIPEAVRLLPEELCSRIHLIVIGDGEQRAELEQRGRDVFGPRLHMAGFVNQAEIGRWYAAADCLVLPSKKGAGETWGLVVNEALQFGLPAVVSDGVGCRLDLIDENTGRVFHSGAPDDMARVLQEICAHLLIKKTAFTKACRGRAEHYSLTVAENRLAEVLHQTAGDQVTST